MCPCVLRGPQASEGTRLTVVTVTQLDPPPAYVLKAERGG